MVSRSVHSSDMILCATVAKEQGSMSGDVSSWSRCCTLLLEGWKVKLKAKSEDYCEFDNFAAGRIILPEHSYIIGMTGDGCISKFSGAFGGSSILHDLY